MTQEVDATRIPELSAVIGRVLQRARESGASQAEADVSLQKGLSVTVRMGEVDTIEYHRDRGLSVTVYMGQRKGSASTGDLRDAAVDETVAKACAIASHTAADPCAGLADATLMARDIVALDLDHPWSIEPQDAIALAKECESAGLGADQRLQNSEGATLSTHRGVRLYGNSHGFLGGFPSTSHSLSCALLAEQDGQMQRDYWYSVARAPDALESASAIGRQAAQRTVARLGARRLATQRARILFAPEMARGLIGSLVGAISGSSQYRRSSFLLDSAGQQLFPAFLNIQERPHLPRGLASTPFDSEGVATRDRELVSNGVLDGYVLGSYSARKLGLKTTGNAGGTHNLIVSAPAVEQSFEQLLRHMGTGLLVTEMMGQGVNGVTGDYSRGATGFWIDNGALAYPVHEVTVAGNLREMYQRIVGVGTDVDLRGGVRCGSLLVEELMIAGE
jgi:PmbA protein